MTARERLVLRRAMRLVRPLDFERVYREGNRARGDWMTVAAAPNERGITRLGLSVGKRAFRRAVDRNRARRIFREAFRLSYAELPAGVDLVVIGSQPRQPELASTRRELVHLAHKALSRYREKVARAEGRDREEGADA